MLGLKVFVSSAINELECEREIATRTIKDLGLDASLFEGFPAMNKAVEGSYLDEVRDCDIFVLMLWLSLRPAVEKEYEEATKSGKPVLVFVKMLKEDEERDQRLHYFLGRIPSKYGEFRGLGNLEEQLSEGIVGVVTRELKSKAIVTNTREEMYDLGAQIAGRAKERLYVFQKTPSLLLGPRNYHLGDGQTIPHEEEFNKALEHWVEKCVNDNHREFICLYDEEQTRKEIQEFQLGERVRQAVVELKRKESQLGNRVRLAPAPARCSGPMGIGDNWFAIWLMGTDNALCISYVNEKISDALASIIKQASSKPTTAQDLLRGLGIS